MKDITYLPNYSELKQEYGNEKENLRKEYFSLQNKYFDIDRLNFFLQRPTEKKIYTNNEIFSGIEIFLIIEKQENNNIKTNIVFPEQFDINYNENMIIIKDEKLEKLIKLSFFIEDEYFRDIPSY